MAFQFLFLIPLFIVLLLLLPLLKTFKRNKNKKSKLPPGPYKLPLIGNLHNLISSKSPHHKLRDLAKKYGPLMQLQLGEIPTVIVTSSEFAKEVMKTHDVVFAQRPQMLVSKIFVYGGIDIVFSPYGDYWRQLRKICTVELLNSKKVESFRSIREEEVRNLIKSVISKQGSPVNLSEMIFSFAYGFTSRSAFGIRCRDRDKFSSIIAETTKMGTGFSLADLFPSRKMLETVSLLRMRLEKMHRRADEILEEILKEHRERRRTEKVLQEDLVDVLLRLQEREFPLPDNSIKAVILDIFAAGSETSSAIVEWAISELLKNQTLMRRTQSEIRKIFNSKGKIDESSIQEMKLLKSVVQETLRLHPAAPLLVPRESRETCKIKNYEIPAKTRVIINAWAIHRDPKNWKDPEKFDPERFLDGDGNGLGDFRGRDFGYIPFGSGRRICPGIAFAIPNVELPLAELLYCFDWEFPEGKTSEDLDMVESFGLTVRRKNDLVLVPVAYDGLPVV